MKRPLIIFFAVLAFITILKLIGNIELTNLMNEDVTQKLKLIPQNIKNRYCSKGVLTICVNPVVNESSNTDEITRNLDYKIRAIMSSYDGKCWILTDLQGVNEILRKVSEFSKDIYERKTSPQGGRLKPAKIEINSSYRKSGIIGNIMLETNIRNIETGEFIQLPTIQVEEELLNTKKGFIKKRISILIYKLKENVRIINFLITLTIFLFLIHLYVTNRYKIRSFLKNQKIKIKEKGRRKIRCPIIGIKASGKTHAIITLCGWVTQFELGEIDEQTRNYYSLIRSKILQEKIVEGTSDTEDLPIKININKVIDEAGEEKKSNILLSTEDISGSSFVNAVDSIYDTPSRATQSTEKLKKLFINNDALIVMIDLVRDNKFKINNNPEGLKKLRHSWGEQVHKLFVAINWAIDEAALNNSNRLDLIYLMFTKTDMIQDSANQCNKVIKLELSMLKQTLKSKGIRIGVGHSQSLPFVSEDEESNFLWVKELIWHIYKSFYQKGK